MTSIGANSRHTAPGTRRAQNAHRAGATGSAFPALLSSIELRRLVAAMVD